MDESDDEAALSEGVGSAFQGALETNAAPAFEATFPESPSTNNMLMVPTSVAEVVAPSARTASPPLPRPQVTLSQASCALAAASCRATGGDADGVSEEASLEPRLQSLDSAIADATKGLVTNARKWEALAALEELLPSLPKAEILKHRARCEDMCEKLLSQGATLPIRRSIVAVLAGLHRHDYGSYLPSLLTKLLKVAGDASKKTTVQAKVACLGAVGLLVEHHPRALDCCSTEIFVVVAKHMKFSDASDRVSAFQCLCRTMEAGGLRTPGVAANLWKMLQKMFLDKAMIVRVAVAHALAGLARAAPVFVVSTAGGSSVFGEAMAACCLKALSLGDEPIGLSSPSVASECRFAYAEALAQVLAAMASPSSWSGPGATSLAERSKKKPIVSDLASAFEFLEQSASKGPACGIPACNLRAALSLSAVRLAESLSVNESASIAALMRVLLGNLDVGAGAVSKHRGSSAALATVAEEETTSLQQLARHVSCSLRSTLLLADSEACLLEVVDLALLPLVSAQFNDSSRGIDMQSVAVLETLSHACVLVGDGFRRIVSKVTKPLLHIVGNHPNPLVQLHAAYCMRVVARNSPAQLFPLMSVLLNLATVQNAEILGTPSKGGVVAMQAITDSLQLLQRGLFGHCAALASLAGELYRSTLGVPHDVASAILTTARALLNPHRDIAVTAQRRSCSFLLLEGLMCLGTDWVGQRLTSLFALWKAALGKKPVDRARVLYQQYAVALQQEAGSNGSGGASVAAASAVEVASMAVRDELMSLLCALRSLYAFTAHSNDTLLTSLPHLHKILVVFLTNISQLVVALPHPAAAGLRKTLRHETRPTFSLAAQCGIPDLLLAIRSTTYRTFAAMLPTQYSSRFVPLLNMLADDVTRPLPAEFPVCEFLAHFLSTEDIALDLADPFSDVGREGSASVRLAAGTLLSTAPIDETQMHLQPEPIVTGGFAEAAAAAYFCSVPKEGPNGTEALLTPWETRMDLARPLATQCVSTEWEWRCSAVTLLATIMNASEVSEAPKAAVMLHLLKKRDTHEDPTVSGGKRVPGLPPSSSTPAGIVAGIAVLAYLRQHVQTWGIRAHPPAAAVEHLRRQAIDGLRDICPVVRRLNVEVLALLVYIYHQHPESTLANTVLQHMSTESTSDSAPGRSSVALLCGAILRAFTATELPARQGDILWPDDRTSVSVVAPKMQCPYFKTIVAMLLRLAKDTTQPVRLWMLHSVHLCMRASGPTFAPFLKDTIRLATAHLLADFFESPLVLWGIAQLVWSAASHVLSIDDNLALVVREEHVTRLLGLWNELKHFRLSGSAVLARANSPAFATVRTEVLCIATAHAAIRVAPTAFNRLQDVFGHVSDKLTPTSSSLSLEASARAAGGVSITGSASAAVRTAAARCITDLVGPDHGLVQDGPLVREPSQLFSLLEVARSPEQEVLQELVRALIRQRGLATLSMWLQTLKEIILALPPKSTGSSGCPVQQAEAKARDDQQEDDEAAMAAAGAAEAHMQGRLYRAPRSATKGFAAACVCLLVEQVDQADASQFEVDVGAVAAVRAGGASSSASLALEQRLVVHLETLVALAAHASNSEEESLATAGLRLMLLVVDRFRRTRDVQSFQDEDVEAPLLLVQYEASLTSCVRHNLRPQTNPQVVRLALQLLRDIVLSRACASPQRLVALLAQPLSKLVFEPDPLYCEGASTITFLYRLRVCCEFLDEADELEGVTVQFRDLSRWLVLALRDAAVLLAGLPLTSIKTYQPATFSITDYKALQPCFREALPTLLRGVCALLVAPTMNAVVTAKTGGTGIAAPANMPELVSLSLGLVVLLLGESRSAVNSQLGATCVASSPALSSSELSLEDLRVLLRCVRLSLVYLFSSSQASSACSLGYVLDLFGQVWRHVFCLPSRCFAVLPDLLELAHAVSGSLRQERLGRQEGRNSNKVAEKDDIKVDDRPFLHEIIRETQDAKRARAIVGAYFFNILAAALRCPLVLAENSRVSMALEVYIWWFESELPRSLGNDVSWERAEDEFASAVLEVEDELGVGAPSPNSDTFDADSVCPWLWMLFTTAFPLELVHSHAALVLKHWKNLCSVLGCPSVEGVGPSYSVSQLMYLSLVATKLSKSLSIDLERGHHSPTALNDADERGVVYLFALLVPVVTALSGVFRRMVLGASPGEGVVSPVVQCLPEDRSRNYVRSALERVQEVFEIGFNHSRPKLAGIAISSLQTLLQPPSNAFLGPYLLPSLLLAIAQPRQLDGASAVLGQRERGLEAAWGVVASFTSSHVATPAVEADVFGRVTLRMVINAILIVTIYDRKSHFFESHRSAMAECLVVLARSDPLGIKAEMDSMPVEAQQIVQDLIREQLAVAAAERNIAGVCQSVTTAKLSQKKIELKMKF